MVYMVLNFYVIIMIIIFTIENVGLCVDKNS